MNQSWKILNLSCFVKCTVLLSVCLVFTIFCTSGYTAEETKSLNRLRALGQAYMEEEEFPNAIDSYKQAVALEPQSASDRVNLGIAYYHGDHNKQAIQTLENSLELDPNNIFAFYTLGLAHKKIGDSTSALHYFQKVAEQDDTDAATTYNVGLALSKIGRADEAVPWFEKTIELDPKHSSSYYQLMMHAMRSKNRNKALELQKKFRELKQTEEQKPPDAVDEGTYLGPIVFEIPRSEQLKFTSDLSIHLQENIAFQQSLQEALGVERGRFLAVIPDVIQKQILAIVSSEKGCFAVLQDQEMHAKQITEPVYWSGCAYTDYDNDEDPDLLLYGNEKTILLRNDGNLEFTDTSETIGLPQSGSHDAVWVDFDHEGDLDLILACKDADNLVYQNNGDGSFTNITGQVEGLDLTGTLAISVCDFDNDNDLDFVRINSKKQLEIISNLRQNRFTKVNANALSFDESSLENLQIECRDFDNDRRMDIAFTNVSLSNIKHSNTGKTLVFRVNEDWSLSPLEPFTLDDPLQKQIRAVFDANNDGYDDFLADYYGERSPVLYLNQFPLPPQANEHEIPLKRMSPVLTADYDFEGDLDVFTLSDEGKLTLLMNGGGNRNHWISMTVKGNKNSKDGYGSKVIVKDGLFLQKKEITSAAVHLGLGSREQTDVIRMTWPNGIFQNVIHAAADQILHVTEKPGYVGSCAFVYAWNGDKFEFIADSLCTAPIGLYVGGGYFPPDPEEFIRIRGDQLQAKDGKLELRIREELREIIYFDEVELLSVSHPSEIDLFVNERFTTPPFPEFKLIGMSPNARPPRNAVDQNGNDVTELLAENDHHYPRPFSPSRYTGLGNEHHFEIDLGALSNAETIYLFMTGYVDWPSSSEALALEQNPSLDFVMPYLQVKNEQGDWVTALNPMGFPAGKLKTVPLDISNIFPTEDRTIRIVSTLQIHWDQILVDTTPILKEFKITKHPLLTADLRYGGYSKPYILSGRGPTWYDYNVRFTNSRWDYQTGFFTRFGDVFPLLQDFDDQYVIMQHGDEVALQFQNNEQTKANDRSTTTHFLRFAGWVKDADHLTAYGSTVEPLPFKAMSGYPYGPDEFYPLDTEHLDYLATYNTREIRQTNEPMNIPQKITQN